MLILHVTYSIVTNMNSFWSAGAWQQREDPRWAAPEGPHHGFCKSPCKARSGTNHNVFQVCKGGISAPHIKKLRQIFLWRFCIRSMQMLPISWNSFRVSGNTFETIDDTIMILLPMAWALRDQANSVQYMSVHRTGSALPGFFTLGTRSCHWFAYRSIHFPWCALPEFISEQRPSRIITEVCLKTWVKFVCFDS